MSGFTTFRALHRAMQRRRSSSCSGRASLPHPSSTSNHPLHATVTHKHAGQTFEPERRTARQASYMRANHATLSPESLPALNNSCGFARRARRGVAPTFLPTPSLVVKGARRAGRVSEGASSGPMGILRVVVRAGSSEHGLMIQLAALPDPPPALGGLKTVNKPYRKRNDFSCGTT